MAMMIGNAGKVVWNAEDGVADVDVSNVVSWSLDAIYGTSETTAMNGLWRTYLGGFIGWTVTVECRADDGGPEVPYADATNVEGLGSNVETGTTQKVFIELWFTQAAAGGLLYGPCICTGISHAQGHEDTAMVTYTFQSNGQLLFKSAEPDDFEEPLE